MLEVACFSLKSALNAIEGGADRIELCTDYSSGGITPPLEIFLELRKSTTKPIFVMIRPRPGSFIHSESEIEIMNQDIENFKEAGADGFVFGLLTKDLEIDIPASRHLIEKAEGLPCTFHRAFDLLTNPAKAVEKIINFGFSSILTSGGKATALDGAQEIRKLIKIANSHINIIPGGGIRSTNIKIIKEIVQSEFYHSAAIIDSGAIANIQEIKALKIHL
jgi:copper homeostasis protein